MKKSKNILSAIFFAIFAILSIGSTDKLKDELSTAIENEFEAAFSDDNSPLQISDPSSIKQVTVRQIYEAYQADKDKADATYKNKIFIVSGTISDIDIDPEDADVMLKTPYAPMDMHCHMTERGAEAAKSLKKGQSVKILGRVGGKYRMSSCEVVR